MRIQALHDLYWKAYRLRLNVLGRIAPVYLSKWHYKKRFNRTLDLDNPTYLNEKLMWLKLNKYTNNDLVRNCIDKYKVREYISSCGLDYILNDLLGVWDDVDEIEWEKLPDRFAIKCNHGCAMNIICKDKSKLNIHEAKAKLRKWMRMETWPLHAETNYRGIKHKIIAEKFLDGLDGALPVDYKIYCFNGEPKYIGNFIERNIEAGSLVRGYFNLDWTLSDVFAGKDAMDVKKFPKPARLNDMLEIARILSKPFPFVRVDLYEVKGKVYFGELTFTPTGCLGSYYTKEASLRLGQALDITQDVKNA